MVTVSSTLMSFSNGKLKRRKKIYQFNAILLQKVAYRRMMITQPVAAAWNQDETSSSKIFPASWILNNLTLKIMELLKEHQRILVMLMNSKQMIWTSSSSIVHRWRCKLCRTLKMLPFLILPLLRLNVWAGDNSKTNLK